MATSRISGTKKRGPGRPKIGAIQVQVRVPPSEMVAINDWIKAQVKPKPSRPKAIRRLVGLGLASAQPAGPHNKKVASKASEMAGQEIDRLGDQSAPAEERESRKRRLLKGPKEFRDIRSDRPKAKAGR
jgi:hypothetical protein